MPTADEVVVEFEAKVDGYVADLNRARNTFERSVGSQEARMQQFERQMRASSSHIAIALKGLAGTFAAAFSARELGQLSDAYTRIQNNMRVAGLEGESLAAVQGRLLDISQRYGADLEGLSQVFLRASMAQADLGASTEQIIQLNEIIAASLKVTGTSSEQAAGALLQLGQALGAGVVRAEEFNSILEGALPLAQAAARGIDGFGGSVSKLRTAVADGQITSQQFFEGVLRGGIQTLADAEKATLTLSGGFTALTSALTVYLGEADQASGASAALGQALAFMADNLDTLIPAITAIALGLGIGFVTNAARANLAGLTTAGTFNHMTLQATRGTTALGALGIAARGAGASLLTAFGGPVGIALTAVALGISYIVANMESAEDAAARLRGATEALATENDRLADRLQKAGVAVGGLGSKADDVANKMDGLSGSMRLTIGVANDLINKLAQLDIAQTAAEVGRLSTRREFIRNPNPLNGPQEAGQAIFNALGLNQRTEEVAAIDRQIGELMRGLELRAAAMRAGVDIAGGGTGGGAAGAPGKPKKAAKAAKPTGPSVEEIQARFEAEMTGYAQQSLSAMQQVARSAEERAELETRAVEWARRQTLLEIANDEHYNAVQKAELAGAVERLAQYERDAIDFAMRRQLEQEAADLADERAQAEMEQLRLAYDLANTEANRRNIALQILDAEDALLRSKLEAIIASETATEAEQERARIALEAVNSTAGARRGVVERQHQGALGRYLERTSDPEADAQEAAARELQAVRDGLAEGLADKLGMKNGYVKDMLSIFLDQVLFRPIAEALEGARSGGSGGLGGLFGSITGAIFGRSGGGPVRAGRPYEVGENGRELFVPQQNGIIVPNQRLAPPGAAGGNTQVIQVDARGAVMNDQFASMILRQAKSYAADAGSQSYQKALKDAPNAVRNAQRYGGR